MRKWRTNSNELQIKLNKAENAEESPNVKGKILGYI